MTAMSRKTPVMAASLLTAILLWMVPCAWAGWPGDPAVNVPICTERYAQSVPSIATDGSGGGIIAWGDWRYQPNVDIYAQRVDSEGEVRWDSNGVSVCTAIHQQYVPMLVTDKSGGAIIAWEDYRNGPCADVYAQRVDSLGIAQWEANGVPVCTTASGQRLWDIVPDGSGGAILVWVDESGERQESDVYAQRIDGDGNILWLAEGVAVCTLTGDQLRPVLAPDGSGGVIVAWEDWRNTGQSGIYAQRVDSSGTLCWTTGGVPVCTAIDDQEWPAVAPDGAGGATVVWWDHRSAIYGSEIYTQSMDSSGTIRWTENGILISSGSFPRITEDGAGGAIIAWRLYSGLYAQRVDGEGQLRWDPGGVTICTTFEVDNSVVADGSGGAIVVWRDTRAGYQNWDIYAQRIDSVGNTLWAEQGAAVCTAERKQLIPVTVSDGSGGAIVTWADERNISTSGIDVYAQRVYADGSLTQLPGLVTGGGWIPGDGPGDKRTFGFNVHAEAGAVWGQLQFNDHGAEMRVHSDTMRTLAILPGDTIANFSGDCRVDGVSGCTFECEVMDRGEPGHGVDWFSIDIYDAGGNPYYSADDFLGGGNIQIHMSPGGDFEKGRFVKGGSEPEEEPGRDPDPPPKMEEGGEVLPMGQGLSQNSPNPFTDRTTISFHLPASVHTTLEICDMTGRLVVTLVDEKLSAGAHSVAWESDGASTGVYFCRLAAGDFVATKKMLVLK